MYSDSGFDYSLDSDYHIDHDAEGTHTADFVVGDTDEAVHDRVDDLWGRPVTSSRMSGLGLGSSAEEVQVPD